MSAVAPGPATDVVTPLYCWCAVAAGPATAVLTPLYWWHARDVFNEAQAVSASCAGSTSFLECGDTDVIPALSMVHKASKSAACRCSCAILTG
jgi:hypothetical protein